LDVKSAFLYGKVIEEVYVCQPPGFEDPNFPDRVYKVKKALYRLHHAPKAWFTKVKNASTPIETQKPLLKDEDGEEVDVHMYRSMIGSLMYLTSSIPFWSTTIAKTINGEAQIHAWVDSKEIIITESSVRRDLQLADGKGVDCFPSSTIFENIELIGLVRAATTASSLEVEQDSELCTYLQSKVLDLEKTKTTQALEITSLKRRIKKLEKKKRSRTHKLKRLYKVGLTARVDSFEDEKSLGEDASKQGRKINDIDADEDITLVNDQDGAEMFNVNDLHGEDVFVEKEVVDKEVSAAGEVNAASIATTVSAATTITTEEITLAQALDDVQAKIDDDHQLAERLQAEEQQKLTDEEKATLFMQLLEKIRKFFTAKRAEDIRNKPPTQAQQSKIMCTYLKNVEGKKLKDLKNKSFHSIHKMFDRAFNRVKDKQEKDKIETKPDKNGKRRKAWQSENLRISCSNFALKLDF
nr:ribonuclease H-like domain-containing protein [Tanacetum cinerariifolium]